MNEGVMNIKDAIIDPLKRSNAKLRNKFESLENMLTEVVLLLITLNIIQEEMIWKFMAFFQ